MTEERSARKAVDRAEQHAKSPHCTIEEHDAIMVAVRLARNIPSLIDEARLAERSKVEEVAYQVMRNWRLSTTGQEDEPSAGYPLVDAVSTPGTDIGTGEEELREIAHEIITAIRKVQS